MSVFRQAKQDIDRGLAGLNMGLPMGLDRTDQLLFGVQPGMYYLVGGDTGSGKSHLLNNLFLLNPLDHLRNNGIKKKVKILYFSFEMAARAHILRALPRHLWLNDNIVTDVNTILSRGQNNKIPADVYKRVLAAEAYFDWLESHITFVDSAMGKTKIEKLLRKTAEENGIFIGEPGEEVYQPTDPDQLILVILDHNGLSKRETEKDIKGVIDGISKVFVDYRNRCGFSFVVLNQFNRDIQSSDRKKLGSIEPQLSDFKDTSGSQEDADLVIALADPWRYGHNKYKDFDISILQDKFRCLHVLKNRSGATNKHIGLNFFGNLGIFEELPRAKDMTIHDYSWATDLELRRRTRETNKP